MFMKQLKWIFVRYALATLAVFCLPFFYKIFRPITYWLLFFFSSIFYNVSFNGNYLLVDSFSVELVDACIAGSAYLLLLLLNLLTPKIKFHKRIFLFLVSSVMFLIINIFRLLVTIPFLGKNGFATIHITFWFISIAFVVAIWFFCVRVFNLKEIPVYSDVKTILKFLKSREK